MREIIDVELKTRKVDFSKCKTDLLAVGLFSDAKGLDKLNTELNGKLNGAIERLTKLGDFKAKEGTSAIVYDNESIGAERVMLVGLGEKKKATLYTVRSSAALSANKAVEMKIKNVSVALHRAFGARFDMAAMARACAEGVYFGSYRYDEFVTSTKDGRPDSLEVRNAHVSENDFQLGAGCE